MNQEDRLELVNYWINKANTTLDDAEFLIQHLKLNIVVNRIYYACYYAVSALLILNHIYAKSHSGVKQMLGLHFIKNGIITEKISNFYFNIFD